MKNREIEKYDPVKCLQEEVDRFRATNQFSPMLVTNFYSQAAVVLSMLDEATKRGDRLALTIETLRAQMLKMEMQLCDAEEEIRKISPA